MNVRMMRVSALCLLVLASATTSEGQALSPQQVAAALADTKHDGAYKMGPFRVTTPYARVVEARKEAERALRPVTAADLPADILGSHIVVWAFPYATGGVAFVPPGVNSPVRIVVRPARSRDLAQAVQPVSLETVPQSFGNAMGATWPAQAVGAIFPREVIATGQWEIVAIYQAGNTRTAKLTLAGKQ